jgi:hypothetical protein
LVSDAAAGGVLPMASVFGTMKNTAVAAMSSAAASMGKICLAYMASALPQSLQLANPLRQFAENALAARLPHGDPLANFFQCAPTA